MHYGMALGGAETNPLLAMLLFWGAFFGLLVVGLVIRSLIGAITLRLAMPITGVKPVGFLRAVGVSLAVIFAQMGVVTALMWGSSSSLLSQLAIQSYRAGTPTSSVPMFGDMHRRYLSDNVGTVTVSTVFSPWAILATLGIATIFYAQLLPGITKAMAAAPAGTVAASGEPPRLGLARGAMTAALQYAIEVLLALLLMALISLIIAAFGPTLPSANPRGW